MNEPKVPVFLAVGFWAASALAVLSYTYIAFKETANGLESGAMQLVEGSNPLVATAGVLAAELTPQKKLERGKFRPSR